MQLLKKILFIFIPFLLIASCFYFYFSSKTKKDGSMVFQPFLNSSWPGSGNERFSAADRLISLLDTASFYAFSQKDLSVPVPVQPPAYIDNDDGDVKFYQFLLGENGYSTKLSVMGKSSTVQGLMGISASVNTYVGKNIYKYGSLQIDNTRGKTFDLKDALSKPLIITPASYMPFALIYQTYTEDSYCKIQSDKDIAENRSNDLTKGVVKAGDTVYGVLKGNYKLNSIHNTDVFDANPAIAPTLSSAFASGVLKTIPNLSLLVDIDRDVVSNNNGVKYGPVVNFRDINYAPVLFTVICNQNTDIFYTNIKMALVLAEKFEYEVPGITRGIQIETDSRYDISGEIPTVMVKLGYDGNFVYDVNNTSEVFGKILGETYTK